MTRIVIAFFLLFATPAAAFDPLTGADGAHGAVAADRSAVGRVIHLYGDSISRGYALGQFGETVPSLSGGSANPLYPFGSIRATANWILQINNRLPHDVFVYGGSFANQYGSLLSNIAQRIKDGVIRSGDVVIVEDAGDHDWIGTPDDYEAWWADIRRTITERHDITLVMMSMFEYCHSGNFACDPANQYDHPVGGRTYNEATEAAAKADQHYVGQTLWVDMNALMDAKRAEVLATYGVDIMLADGVHPYIWGQNFMAGIYLKVSGARLHVSTVEAIKDHVAANISLFQGGGSLTAPDAATLTEEMLLP